MQLESAPSFLLEEFVPKEIYASFGYTSVKFLSPKLPIIAQGVRDRFGKKVTINDWIFGGTKYNYSGYRPPNCKEGSFFSRHKLGLAEDLKIDGVSSKEFQDDVKKNYEAVYKPLGVTAMEEGTNGWTHLSCEWTLKEGLLLIPFYSPKKGDMKNVS